MTGGVLVLDFDGTVCLGDAPVLKYADAILLRVPEGERSAAAERMASGLRGYFAGERQPDLVDAPDGYYAVARLAAELGVSVEDRNAAYTESRTAVHAGLVPIFAPPGLRELLVGIRSQVRVVLVTNAPEHGVETLLSALGLQDLFDEVHGDAGKPAGMGPILDRLLQAAAIAGRPERLLSVGDIWANDLEPAAVRGCRTAFIDRYGSGGDAADFRAATLVELYPAITRWVHTAVGNA
jgi:FMN phosphatase YigB (HAD superfamily)